MTHPTGPAGGGPGGASGTSPKAINLFEVAIAVTLANISHYAAIGINPDLARPSIVLTCFGLGIYALSLIARHRRTS